MCGINGIIDLYKASEHINTINKMNNLLKHRGPDQSGISIDLKNNVLLGHHRLSIIDINSTQEFISSWQNGNQVYRNNFINPHNVKTILDI